ncbi:MAG: DUF6174 domain-containing protein [Gemmatimonadota bacterium]|nr:DUF6174 domain-containing protein [Gemmatimonadota bacterium]
MRSFVVGLALLGFLAACDSTTTNSNSGQLQLAQHQAQWEHRSFHSYTYDYHNSAAIGNANVHVTVTADTVSSLIDVSTGMPPEIPVNVPTIDGLFLYAHSLLGEKGATVTLEFDSQLGYPTRVSAFDNNPGGGYDARVSNLHPKS